MSAGGEARTAAREGRSQRPQGRSERAAGARHYIVTPPAEIAMRATRKVRRRAIATRPTLDRGMLKFSDEAEV